LRAPAHPRTEPRRHRLAGTINGNKIARLGDFPEDGGTSTIVSMDITTTD